VAQQLRLLQSLWAMERRLANEGEWRRRPSSRLKSKPSDLRLLSSGPRSGLNEINLPPLQPGSSIMPGKVNPVAPELVNQVAFQVIGPDLAATLAAEAGQLQLNVMEPVIAI
jgi:aspartate ammonia-lyase